MSSPSLTTWWRAKSMVMSPTVTCSTSGVAASAPPRAESTRRRRPAGSVLPGSSGLRRNDDREPRAAVTAILGGNPPVLDTEHAFGNRQAHAGARPAILDVGAAVESIEDVR